MYHEIKKHINTRRTVCVKPSQGFDFSGFHGVRLNSTEVHVPFVNWVDLVRLGDLALQTYYTYFQVFVVDRDENQSSHASSRFS